LSSLPVSPGRVLAMGLVPLELCLRPTIPLHWGLADARHPFSWLLVEHETSFKLSRFLLSFGMFNYIRTVLYLDTKADVAAMIEPLIPHI
jgi:hypothetical protein